VASGYSDGWVTAKPPKKRPNGGFVQLYGSPGPTAAQRAAARRRNQQARNRNIANARRYRAQNPEYASAIDSFVAGGADPALGTRADNGFPAYRDRVPDLLSALAASRDREIGSLRSQLEGRSAAIAQLYAGAGAPLEANYNKAIQESSAVNEAVANRLHQEGEAGVQSLTAKLAQIGASNTPISSDIQQVYRGAEGANYAMDAGDIQRLISRLAEEKTRIAEEPANVRRQLESEFNQTVAEIMQDYLAQEADIRSSGIDSEEEYRMAKFQFDQEQKAAQEERLQQLEDQRLEWFKARQEERMAQRALASKAEQRALERRWEIEDKNAERQFQLQRDAIQHGYDVADAKLDAQLNPPKSSQPKASKPGPRGANSQATRSQALTAAKQAVFDSKGRLRQKIYTSRDVDGNIQSIVNAVLQANGISPWSKEGTSIRKAIFALANNQKVPGGTYKQPGYTKPGRKYKPPKKKR